MKESQGDKGGAKAANLELSFKNKEPKGISRKHLDVSKNRGTPKWMVYMENRKPY